LIPICTGVLDQWYNKVIGCLPDLLHWDTIIARFLKPGGFFYMAEGHSFMWLLDDTSSDFKVAHSYTSCRSFACFDQFPHVRDA
jgi:hypothetical protein